MDRVLDNGLCIRPAEPEELPFVAECIRESIVRSVTASEAELSDLWADTTVAIAMDSLASRKMQDEVFVLSDGDALNGMLWLGRSADQYTCEETGYVLGICVSEKMRRKGIGTALLKFAEDWCRENGLISLALDVGYENSEARAFYEKNGYAARSSVLRKPLL